MSSIVTGITLCKSEARKYFPVSLCSPFATIFVEKTPSKPLDRMSFSNLVIGYGNKEKKRCPLLDKKYWGFSLNIIGNTS